MRTVKDFVRQMFNLGKSPKHIRAVAAGSQWKDRMDEIDHWIEIGKKIKRKHENRKRGKSVVKRTKSKRFKIRKRTV